MGKHSETFEHTADLGLRAQADSLPELFEALAEGLADIICPRAQISPTELRALAVEADDLEALAVDFLWEVMSLLQVHHFMASATKVIQVGETKIVAQISGELFDPQRHQLAAEVKAVTHHQLKIAEEDGRWIGRVILDL